MNSGPRMAGSMRGWKLEDDNLLAELFKADELTIDMIAARLGRSSSSVRSRLKILRNDGRVGTKRPGTRRKIPANELPTTDDDVVLAIDMLIDTRIRRDRLGRDAAFLSREHAQADMDEAGERVDNALTHLNDMLRRWRRRAP